MQKNLLGLLAKEYCSEKEIALKHRLSLQSARAFTRALVFQIHWDLAGALSTALCAIQVECYVNQQLQFPSHSS